MNAVSRLVVGYPWVFIALFLALTALGASRLPGLVIDPEIKNQLPEDMPARLNMAQIEERFGGSEMVLVVLQADDVLAPDSLVRLQALSEGIESVEGVERVMSPFTLTRIEGDDGLMVVEAAIEDVPKTPAERAALAESLKANELVYGNVVARDFSAASVIALLKTGAEDGPTMAGIHAAIDAAPGAGTVSIGGMPDVRTQVSRDIRSDMQRFVPVGLLVILGFLYVCFRQIRGVVLPFAVVVMSVIFTMGLIPVFGWKVQMVTVVLPVILLAVANDYGIHLLAKYQEENVPGGPDGPELARRCLADLGPPVLAAGITTMAGLLCLQTHIIVPAAQLGVLAAIGVGFALVCSLGFIPAVLAVLPVAPPLTHQAASGGGRGLEGMLERVSRLVVSRPRTVVAVVAATTVLLSAGIPLIKVDTNPVNYYASDAPVAVSNHLINDHFGGSTELAVMFEGDIQDPAVLSRIDGLEAKLRDMDSVGFTMSIARVVRMMNEAVGGDPSFDAVPTERNAVAQLFLLYSMGGDPEDFERMVDFDYEHALLTARINSLSTQRVKTVVEAVRAEVGDDASVTLGGFGQVFSDLVDAVVQGQLTSLGLSLLLVFVLVSITFRSASAGLYAVLPLGGAMPVLFGLMGYLGIELNIVTAMLSSIMIGVGVDYTIHFLWRYRLERSGGLEAPEAVHRTLVTAGRGIVFNALSVVVGFAVLLISNFLPVKFFGFLVVVSISGCLIGALVLLPALVLVTRPKFLEP